MPEESYSKNWFSLKNLLIYLVVGGVIYGLVYFLFLAKKDNYLYPSADKKTEEQPQNNISMTVVLNAQNGSGETGQVTLTEVDGKTTIILQLNNMPAGVSHPAHIHLGACPNPGAVKYPLSSVENGISETVLDVTLENLIEIYPLAINVHKSASEAQVYVACGNMN